MSRLERGAHFVLLNQDGEERYRKTMGTINIPDISGIQLQPGQSYQIVTLFDIRNAEKLGAFKHKRRGKASATDSEAAELKDARRTAGTGGHTTHSGMFRLGDVWDRIDVRGNPSFLIDNLVELHAKESAQSIEVTIQVWEYFSKTGSTSSGKIFVQFSLHYALSEDPTHEICIENKAYIQQVRRNYPHCKGDQPERVIRLPVTALPDLFSAYGQAVVCIKSDGSAQMRSPVLEKKRFEKDPESSAVEEAPASPAMSS